MLKPACSATETSQINEFLHEASLNIVLCSEWKTKALDQIGQMRRLVCVFVFGMQQSQDFLRRDPYILKDQWLEFPTHFCLWKLLQLKQTH